MIDQGLILEAAKKPLILKINKLRPKNLQKAARELRREYNGRNSI